jgi:hypothetical protein
VLIGVEQEGQVEGVQLGREAGVEGIAGLADVDGAEPYALEDRRVVAEFAGRVDGDRHRPVGQFRDALGEQLRGGMVGVAGWLGVGKAQRRLGLRACRQQNRGGDETRNKSHLSSSISGSDLARHPSCLRQRGKRTVG